MGNTVFPSMTRPSLLRQSLEDFERRFLQDELERHGWNRAGTARDLGICYRALLYKIDRLGLTPPAKEEFSEPSFSAPISA